MDLGRDCNFHFIQTIKNGLVVKMHNVNSQRKPALIFRNMDEVQVAQDHSILSSPGKNVESDAQSLQLVAAGTSRDIDSAINNENVSCSSDGESDLDDCNLVEMTLKQIKQRCVPQKRKLLSLIYTNPAHDVVNCEEEEDEDLNIPLRAFKTKRLSKSSVAKRGRPNCNTSPCSETSFLVKAEHTLNPGFNMQLKKESASSLANVKKEVLEEELSICQSTNSLLCLSSETPILLDKAHRNLQFSVNQHTSSFNDCSSINCDKESSCCGKIPNEVSEAVEVQEKMPALFAEEKQCCTLDDVSMNDNLLCVEIDNSTVNHQADDTYMPEDEVQEDICSSQENESACSPIEMMFPSGDSQLNFSDDAIKSVADSTTSSLTTIPECSWTETGNSCLNAFSVQVESLTPEQNGSPDTVEDITGPTIETQSLDQNSSSLQQPPQRFPSLRKAISPSSQEKLCWEMKSADSFDEVENDIKPLIGKEGSKSSSQGCQQRVITRHEQITRKLKKNCRKGFPHKANSDGPLFSRSLPQLSTGSTSIDSCSNSAVAFSQRQMHDFEFLATKLLGELKSMQDVVEEKLFFNAYRSNSCKSEVDKVRDMINNTKKIEETTRKWISMMARDCTRFCKLMGMLKLSQDHSPSSEISVPRNRKVMFADEAGGMLCSVNYFDDEDDIVSSSPTPLSCEDEKKG